MSGKKSGMDCRRACALLEDGAAPRDEAERAAFAAHLDGCPACRAVAEEEAIVRAALARLPELRPSAALDAALLALPETRRRGLLLAPLTLALTMALCALGTWGLLRLSPAERLAEAPAATATRSVATDDAPREADEDDAAEEAVGAEEDGLDLAARARRATARALREAGLVPEATAPATSATRVALAARSATPPAPRATAASIVPRPGRRGGDRDPSAPLPPPPPGTGTSAPEAGSSVAPPAETSPASPTAEPTTDPGGRDLPPGPEPSPTVPGRREPSPAPSASPPPRDTPEGPGPPPPGQGSPTPLPVPPTPTLARIVEPTPTATLAGTPTLPPEDPGAPPPAPATRTPGPSATTTATATITPTLTATPSPTPRLESRAGARETVARRGASRYAPAAVEPSRAFAHAPQPAWTTTRTAPANVAAARPRATLTRRAARARSAGTVVRGRPPPARGGSAPARPPAR